MPKSIQECLYRRPATSKEIQAYTGLAQPTIARKLRELGETGDLSLPQ